MYSGKKILIVEDNELNQYFLKIIFKPTNADLNICVDYDEYKEKYSDDYDLILLDIMIPGKHNGFYILKEIRETNKNVPIVMQSAYTEMYRECIENGADDFLEKPITYTRMVEVLNKFLLNESKVSTEK